MTHAEDAEPQAQPYDFTIIFRLFQAVKAVQVFAGPKRLSGYLASMNLKYKDNFDGNLACSEFRFPAANTPIG